MLLSTNIMNYFALFYGVCAVLLTGYLLRQRDKYEDARRERGIKKSKLDKVVAAFIVIVVISSLIIAYNTLNIFFKMIRWYNKSSSFNY